MLAGSGMAATQVPAAAGSESSTLSAQRHEIEAQYQSDLAQCSHKFAVSSCELDARAKRNAALKPLQLREQDLADARRKAQAQAQQERIKAKAAELQDHQGELEASSPASERPPALLPRQTSSGAIQDPVSHAKALEARDRAQAQEALQRQQDKLARERQSQLHKEQILKRESECKKPLAAPLPLPAASDIAALPDHKR
ncbi:MAG: hypothetical protein JOY60_07790 [Burkholderiaceae bacterium]|nr:hypothetical protein [Burkholderiaceae bacterium]